MAQYTDVNVIDVPLSNLAVAYSMRGAIADRVCPRIPVDLVAGKFWKRTKRDLIQVTDDRVGVNGSPGEILQSYSSGSYSCEDYALKIKVMNSIAKNATASVNPYVDATEALLGQIEINHEVRVASLLTTSGNYASNNYSALTGADRWDTSTGNPIKAVLDLKTYLWRSPNTRLVAFCSEAVHNKLRVNPFVMDAIRAGGSVANPALATAQTLAALFEVDEYVVGTAYKDTGTIGGTSSESLVWPKSFGIVAVADRPSTMCAHFASCFTFNSKQVYRWSDPEPGVSGAEWVKASHSSDEVIVASDAGILLGTVIS